MTGIGKRYDSSSVLLIALPRCLSFPGTNGYYTISYVNNAWTPVTLSNLPTYTTVTENETTVTKTITGYYVVEQGMDNKPIAVTYKVGDASATETCTETMNGNITIINTDTTGKVQVTKTFSGVENLPEGFKLTAQWGEHDPYDLMTVSSGGEVTTDDGLMIHRTDGDHTYTWTIDGLPVNTKVFFEESGYNKDGYNWNGTVTNQIEEEGKMKGGAVASSDDPLPTTAQVDFENTYTAGVELPATGGSGTLIYTVAGMGLIVLAGMLLVSRKRKYNR